LVLASAQTSYGSSPKGKQLELTSWFGSEFKIAPVCCFFGFILIGARRIGFF
jgi:hypothetical protein